MGGVPAGGGLVEQRQFAVEELGLDGLARGDLAGSHRGITASGDGVVAAGVVVPGAGAVVEGSRDGLALRHVQLHAVPVVKAGRGHRDARGLRPRSGTDAVVQVGTAPPCGGLEVDRRASRLLIGGGGHGFGPLGGGGALVLRDRPHLVGVGGERLEAGVSQGGAGCRQGDGAGGAAGALDLVGGDAAGVARGPPAQRGRRARGRDPDVARRARCAGVLTRLLTGAGVQGNSTLGRDPGGELAAGDRDGLALPGRAIARGGDHVVVVPVGQRRGELALQVTVAVVDGNRALVAAVEGHRVAVAAGPLVRHLGAVGLVAEAHHVHDVVLGVLERPAVLAGLRVHDAAGTVERRALVLVAELVARVDRRRAVAPRQGEDLRQVVGGAVLVGQRLTVAFGVVVVHEHGSVRVAQETMPRAADAGAGDQPADAAAVVEGLLQLTGVGKLVDVTDADVLLGLDRLLIRADHLLHDVEAVLVLHLVPDAPHVLRGDVLHRIEAEPGHPHVHQVVQVARDGGAHVLRAGVQVREVDQVAVLHLPAVAVVVDVPAAAVEVPIRVKPRVVVVLERRAGPAGTALTLAGHVVDHRIDDDLHARVVAGAHHVAELSLGPHSGLELVRHGLVVGPPLGAQHVLLRR